MDRNIYVSLELPFDRVALRKESVDRNDYAHPGCKVISVALRKESVDRNVGVAQGAIVGDCRSPQGERG